MQKFVFAPSLLSADFSDLSGAIKKIEEVDSNGLKSVVHIDVMDGSFVPQITFGQPVIKSIRPLTKLPFDVHLMVEHPETMVDDFAESGADWITFHLESTTHVDRLIHHIKDDLRKKCGVSIVPSTPISALEEILPLVDLVLVMTVNPGFGGQKIIPYCLKKVTELKQKIAENKMECLVSVDGGVNNETLPSVISCGADVIVSGSAFFSGKLDLEI